MQLSTTRPVTNAPFDDSNLIASAGLIPVIELAQHAGLGELTGGHLSVPTDKGANAGLKVTSLVAGMVAGADSIDDLVLLRHGAMGKVSPSPTRRPPWDRCCAPSPSGTSASSTPSPPDS